MIGYGWGHVKALDEISMVQRATTGAPPSLSATLVRETDDSQFALRAGR
ncbi:hypothetical protein [Paraburkholderia sp. DGU8]